MTMRKSALICCWLAWLAPLTAQEPQVDPARAWCERARGLVDGSSLAEAESTYREALRMFQQQEPKQGASADFWARVFQCRIEQARLATLMDRHADAEKHYQAILTDVQSRIKQYPGEAALQLIPPRAHEGLGQMYRGVDRSTPALAQFTEACRLLRVLTEQNPAVAEYREELARTLGQCAAAQVQTARFREAELSYRDDLQIWHKLVQDYPKAPAYREGLALAFQGYAQLARDSARYLHARDLLRSAIAVLEPLPAAFPDQAKHWQHLPALYRQLSIPLEFLQQNRERAAALKSAERWERRLAKLPAPPRPEPDKAGSPLRQTSAADAGTPAKDAEKFHQQAEQRLSAQPGVPALRHQLVTAQILLAMHLGNEQAFDRALSIYRAALAGSAALVKEYPRVPKYQKTYATLHVKVGVLHHLKGSKDEGDKSIQTATALYRKLAEDNPDEPALARGEEEEMSWLLRFMLARDEYQRVLDIMRSTEASLKKLCAAYPQCPAYRHQYAAAPVAQAHLFMQMKETKTALASYRMGIERWSALIADFPDVMEYNIYLCQARSLLVTIHYREREWAKAETEARAMVQAHEKMLAAAPHLAYFHTSLAMDHAWLAALASSQNVPAKAAEHYSQSIALYEKAWSIEPAERGHLELLCKSIRLRADIFQQTGDLAAYQRDMERRQQMSDLLDTPFVRLARIRQRLTTGKIDAVQYDADDLFACGEMSGTEWFELAGLYAAMLSGADPARREFCSARVIASLRKALENGYQPAGPLDREPSFQSLAPRRDFQDLASVRPLQD